MRNLKKLLAVIVSVCVLATFTFPAFAAEKTAAEITEDLGVLKGDSSEGVTDTYLAKGTTRMQAAILYLRLLGLEDEAYAFEGEDNFADADQTWDNAQKALAYLKANPELGWQGVSADKFDPTATISAQQMYKVCLEALGYKQGVDFEWAEVFTFAAEKGLSLIADVTELTNNDTAIALVEVLKLTLKDSKTTLIADLVAKGVVTEAAAIAAGLIAAEPEELEVVSVKATNLKQFVVTFNKPVDSDDATDLDNYDLDAANADVTGGSAALSEDGLSVTITLGTAAADTEEDATVIISGIADEDGNAMEETEVDFTFVDTTFPTALSAEVVGNDTIKVIFSEPIDTFDAAGDDFEVDGGDYIIASATKMNNDTEINIELYSELDEGEVEVKVLNTLEDYAGYNVAKKTLTVNVVEDDDSPVITGYKDANNTKVTLIFDNDIEISDADAENFYHTNSKNIVGADDEVESNFILDEDYELDGKELTLYFNENPMPDGTVYVYVAKDAVNDLWDNKNDKLVCKIEIEEDKDAPTLKDLEVDAQDKITLTFSESIAAASFDEESFALLDKDGKVIEDAIDDATISGTDKIIIEFEDELNGEYSIVIEEVEDLKDNEIAKTTKAFTVKDDQKPGFGDFTATLYNASDKGQMIKVNFDEAMSIDGKYSVLDLEKYTLSIGATDYDLSDVDAEVKIKAVDNNKAVEIYIASDEDDDDDFINIPLVDTTPDDDYVDNVTLTIGRVADAAGNYTAAASGEVDIAVPTEVTYSAKATATNTIVVTFDGKLTTLDTTEFALFGDADGNPATGTVAITPGRVKKGVDADGNTTITYILSDADKLTYDALTAGGLGVYVQSDVTDSKNAYGETVEDGAFIEVDDKIVPELAKITVGGKEVDNVEATSDTTIVLTFTEDIKDTSVSITTFTVGGGDYEVTAVDVTDDEIELTISNPDNKDLDGVKIVQVAPIKDIAGNTLTGISTKVNVVTP